MNATQKETAEKVVEVADLNRAIAEQEKRITDNPNPRAVIAALFWRTGCSKQCTASNADAADLLGVS